MKEKQKRHTKKDDTEAKTDAGDAVEAAGKKEEDKSPEELQAELKDQLLRLHADFDNFRKRTLRERGDVERRAREEIVYELLTVLDHLELGLDVAAAHEADQAFLDGYRMLSEELTGALKKFGLKTIEIEGQEFDPKLHEAHSHIPSDEHPEGAIISQVRKGYLIGDRLLRPAHVVVSSGPASSGDRSDEKEIDSGNEA